eukprot:10938542-Prorocentrum_lima.AAC.1
MGASRAILTDRSPSGAVTYINDKGVAELFVAQLAAASQEATELEQRVQVVATGLKAQQALG